ncbi:MAG: hypothetical protein ACYDCI_08510 [Candidatus Limnocylindrales bacterium]
MAVVLVLIWAAFSSGLVAGIATEVGRWMESQMRFGPTPSP